MEKDVKDSFNPTKKIKTSKLNNQNDNRTHRTYTIRLVIFTVLFMIFTVASLYVASKIFEKEKLQPFSYTQKDSVYYKVYLNENDFYDQEYLEMNKAYVASLIKYIDVDFNYSFNIAKITNMDFNYKIIGELVIENNGGTKRYLEKEYTLLESTKKKLENANSLIIQENLKIDYDYYNKLANTFRSTYGVDTNSYLNVYLEVVSKTSDDLDYSISEKNKIPLKIPLSERAIEINFDSNNKDITKYVVPTGEVQFNFKYLIIEVILFIITAIFFIKFIKYIFIVNNKNNKYDKYINKILKEYDRLVVETDNAIDMSKYNIIEVKKFSELLDVRDNLKVPILYLNTIKHEEGIFYIKNEDDVYLLVIKNGDLINKSKK